MRLAYIFVYSDGVGTREEVKAVLNKIPEIITWRYDMPNTFYVISESPAHVISEKFHSINGDKGTWIFSEVTDNKQGWLTETTWYLLNHKYHKPEPTPKKS